MQVDELGEGARSRLRREKFGFVFQQGLLIPELTAVENVALASMINGVKRAEAVQHAASWLAALGLAGPPRRPGGRSAASPWPASWPCSPAPASR